MPSDPSRDSIIAESYWFTLQPKVAIAKRIGALSFDRAFDETAADHFVSAIKHARLPRRHRRPAMLETHLRSLRGKHPQPRRQRRMPIANLHFERDFPALTPRRLEPCRIDHPYLLGDQPRRIQLVA